MLRYLCFLAAVLGAKSASAPFIQQCKTDDNACLLASANAAVPFIAPGIPELQISSLDPLLLPLVEGDQNGLKLTFKDTTVTGMKGCAVDAIKHDVKKGKLAATIRCSVVLRGDYKMSGRMLVLPISGEGKHVIKIRDIIIKAYADFVTAPGADGKPHWHITDWHHTFTVKTNTHFKFENLFNGNKLLAEPVAQFANSNWRSVMQELGPPVVHAIVSRTVDSVEALFKAVPADELALA
ncbi:hypothetical protein JYU34_017794 [Plutella xylostella]|uniref:Uncharacterized protein n=1 Tax=Plutella xylostella TaxID=51655 RepID=A0ABQ7Q238_PLUXY|nr:hypothetical protein JYU34_017794 [Plutella xylostella]